MATETVAPLTIAELMARIEAIKGRAKGVDVFSKDAAALQREMSTARKALSDAQDAVEGDAREAIRQEFVVAGDLPVPDSARVNYTLKRNTDDGMLYVENAVIYMPSTDGKMGALADYIHETLEAEIEHATMVSSVRTITVNEKGTTVNSGAAPKALGTPGESHGGGRGHGWTRAGVTHTLTAAFNSVATSEQQAELIAKVNASNPQSKGSTSFTYKRTVVQKAGFTAAS